MTNVTHLDAVRAIIERSATYDAATVEIDAEGVVTALKDADKTYAGNDDTRYVVGHVDDLLADAAAGHR